MPTTRTMTVAAASVTGLALALVRPKIASGQQLLSEVTPPGSTHFPPIVDGAASSGGVHTLTGNFSLSATDIVTVGRGPSPVLTRTYNSQDEYLGPFPQPTSVGALGPGWMHNYEMRLVRPTDGNLNDIILVGPMGRRDRFKPWPDHDPWYEPPQGVHLGLLHRDTGFWSVVAENFTTWDFDPGGRLTAILDRYGNRSEVTYHFDGRLAGVSDPAGRGLLQFSYDWNGTGRLTSVIDWMSPHRSVTYTYNGGGRLSTVTDRLGNVTSYGYNGAGQLTTVTDRRGVTVLTNTYDPVSRKVVSQSDAAQQTTVYDWTGPGCAPGVCMTHPPSAFAPSFSPRSEYDYDAQERIVTQTVWPTSSEVYSQSWDYDPAVGTVLVHTDWNGQPTYFCWDVDYHGQHILSSRYKLTRRIDPPVTPGGLRPMWLFRWDTGPNANIAATDPIELISANGVAASTVADCASDISSTIDWDHQTTYTWDGSRLVSSLSWANDPDLGRRAIITSYRYEDPQNPGAVTMEIPPSGHPGNSPDPSYGIRKTYYPPGDPRAGLLASVTNAVGNKVTYDYDVVGRKVSSVDALGNAPGGIPGQHTWSFVYDKEDRLLQQTAPSPFPGGSPLVSEFTYDQIGNTLSAKDASGQIVRYSYSQRNGLSEVWESLNASDPANDANRLITKYEYDDGGNLKRLRRANGSADERVVDLQHDGRGKLRAEVQYPLWPSTSSSLTTQWSYDGNGNVTQTVDPKGQITTFGYDLLGRLTAVNYVTDAATPDASFGYDFEGRRLQMIDGHGTTSYVYDERGQLLSTTSPNGTVGYRYTQSGERRQLIYPDGDRLTYTRDKAGRAVGTTDWTGRAMAFEYWPDGKLKVVTNVNGTRGEYSYDNARRLTSIINRDHPGEVLSQHLYTVDPVGNRTRVDEVIRPIANAAGRPDVGPGARALPSQPGSPATLPAARTLPAQAGTPATLPGTRIGGGGATPLIAGYVAYSYDRLYRLTGTSGPIEAAAYTYDLVGNRTSRTPNGQSAITYTYDKADRILSAGGVAYTVDANGNLTARGTEQLLYDQANRLKELKQNGATVATYAYNGDGSRTSKTVGGVTTPYTYDIRASVAKLLQDGERRYVWRPGLAYATDLTGNTLQHVYHTDGIDSGRVLTDASGAVTDTRRTDVFGVPLYNQGSSTQPFGFAGEQRDAESGLIYLRARQYDPTLGRLVQRDVLRGSLVRPATHNRYTYGLNNPLLYIDPSGLSEDETTFQQADPTEASGDSLISDAIYFQQQDDDSTLAALSILADQLDATNPPWAGHDALVDEYYDEYDERYGDLQEEWDSRGASSRISPQHQSREEHRAEQTEMREETAGLTPEQASRVHDILQDQKGPDGRASREDIRAAVNEVLGRP